ncbi:hypothetical protein EYF80_021983 [Liparis tanakae]|uniref:Uncharacterized protein n=1 Tax=Liparis tanakae TaxID=230148 RepID=A0A4Z2HPQ7_9TELE|nr:hypothetical protein EYF80_021983 [Liparis tanakae]
MMPFLILHGTSLFYGVDELSALTQLLLQERHLMLQPEDAGQASQRLCVSAALAPGRAHAVNTASRNCTTSSHVSERSREISGSEGFNTSTPPGGGQSLFQLQSEPIVGPDGLLQALTEDPNLPQRPSGHETRVRLYRVAFGNAAQLVLRKGMMGLLAVAGEVVLDVAPCGVTELSLVVGKACPALGEQQSQTGPWAGGQK